MRQTALLSQWKEEEVEIDLEGEDLIDWLTQVILAATGNTLNTGTGLASVYSNTR